MKRLVLVLALLAAAGCAPMEWTRSDATQAQMEADMRACRDQAFREASWYWHGYYGPAGSPFYYGSFGRSYAWPYYSPFADPWGDRFLEEARLTSFCMRAKGYELSPVTK